MVGVHLDEPLTPQRSWDADIEEKKKLDELFCDDSLSKSPTYSPTSSSAHPMSKSQLGHSGSQTEALCQEFGQSCTASKTSSQGRPASRISKSESPQLQGSGTISKSHSNTTQTDYTQHSSVKMTRSADRLMPGTTSPDTPEGKDGKKEKVNFTFGDDNDSDEESSCLSKPSQSQGASYSRSSSGKEKDHRRGRFKKILRPLRRSHSAGCTKDVPAHALFLRHEMERRKTQPESRAVERGSMERGSSDSDVDEHQEKKGKKKKVPTATLR